MDLNLINLHVTGVFLTDGRNDEPGVVKAKIIACRLKMIQIMLMAVGSAEIYTQPIIFVKKTTMVYPVNAEA